MLYQARVDIKPDSHYTPCIYVMLIPVVERSKTRVYGRSLAGIAGSNPAGGMDVCAICCRGINDMNTKDIKVHNG